MKALERMGFSAFSGDVSQFLEEVKEHDKKCKNSSPLPACRNSRGRRDLMTAANQALSNGSESMVLIRMLVSLLGCCLGHVLPLSRTMQCRLGDEGKSEVQALRDERRRTGKANFCVLHQLTNALLSQSAV